MRAFVFKNPVLLAVVAGLLAPASLAPAALVEVSHAIVFAALPWGFFCAGVILAEHLGTAPAGAQRRMTPPIGAAIVHAPRAGAAAAARCSRRRSSTCPPAYLLAAATPAGLNGLTVAHAYGLDLRLRRVLARLDDGDRRRGLFGAGAGGLTCGRSSSA